MNRQKSLERVIELFGLFRQQVQSHNKAGLFDINSLSEDVMIPVFRDVFEAPFLRNLNRERRNYPGLDLGDDQARIAFQITADSTIDKIKDTLQKIVSHRHYLRYDAFYIYHLKEKQSRYNKKALLEITKGYFVFDPTAHIIDSSAVVARLQEREYEVIRRVEETLEVHLVNPKRYFVAPRTLKETETLIIDLLPIAFPKELFIGKVAFDRQEIIRNSWVREFRLSHKASQRRVVQAALDQKGLKFSSAWIISSGEIMTFHDLRDETLQLSALVEPATIDPIPVNRFIKHEDGSLNIDRFNLLRELLRTTLQAQLWHRGITWQHEERLFIFVSKEKRLVRGKEQVVEPRREQWSRGTKEGRIVYRIHWWEDDPTKFWYHEHLAFEVNFDFYDHTWYMAIKPDWFCSRNGYNKSKFHKNRISFLKKKAHNLDVLDDLRFIAEVIRKDQEETLLPQAFARLLNFGDIVTLDGAPAIKDKDWLQEEEKKKRNALERPPEAPLFGTFSNRK